MSCAYMSMCIYINLHAYTKVYYANIYYKYIILNDIKYIVNIYIHVKKTRLNVFDGKDTLVRLTISNHTKKKWGHPTHPSYILWPNWPNERH